MRDPMRDIRLSDGTWATTAIQVQGLEKTIIPCLDDLCEWEDFGPPVPPGLLPVPAQLQRCKKCRWVRGRYLGDPYSNGNIK